MLIVHPLAFPRLDWTTQSRIPSSPFQSSRTSKTSPLNTIDSHVWICAVWPGNYSELINWCDCTGVSFCFFTAGRSECFSKSFPVHRFPTYLHRIVFECIWLSKQSHHLIAGHGFGQGHHCLRWAHCCQGGTTLQHWLCFFRIESTWDDHEMTELMEFIQAAGLDQRPLTRREIVRPSE